MEIRLSPVSASDRPDIFPAPWPDLEISGLSPALIDRARRFAVFGEREGFADKSREILSIVGKGFNQVAPFGGWRSIARDDPDRELKEQACLAFARLSDEFTGYISGAVWTSLASLALRPDPQIERSILSVQEHLPLPWWFVDTVLHATGKVYSLMMHIQSRIYRETGFILDHNCDCDHSFIRVAHADAISFELPRERFARASEALFTHILSESVLTTVVKLPFQLGVSKESEEVLALQGRS